LAYNQRPAASVHDQAGTVGIRQDAGQRDEPTIARIVGVNRDCPCWFTCSIQAVEGSFEHSQVGLVGSGRQSK
jgi:hypothetical protein